SDVNKRLVIEQCNAAFAHRCEVAYITLSSFRVNPEFQDFSLQPTGCLCEVIHIRRVDGGAL
ncbi:hypothetical protein CJZ31_22435, partial [Salmonella enterica subsp. enterica serovar Virchow]|uniref:hypothetical protein n=1 Tax=Salmonella enterica TaxID=28901 RepID=UPI000BA9798B